MVGFNRKRKRKNLGRFFDTLGPAEKRDVTRIGLNEQFGGRVKFPKSSTAIDEIASGGFGLRGMRSSGGINAPANIAALKRGLRIKNIANAKKVRIGF